MARTESASAVDAFIARCKTAAKARGIGLSTLSLYVLNDGKVLPRLADGAKLPEPADIGTRKRERAEAELAKFERGKPTSYQVAAGLSGKPADRPRKRA